MQKNYKINLSKSNQMLVTCWQPNLHIHIQSPNLTTLNPNSSSIHWIFKQKETNKQTLNPISSLQKGSSWQTTSKRTRDLRRSLTESSSSASEADDRAREGAPRVFGRREKEEEPSSIAIKEDKRARLGRAFSFLVFGISNWKARAVTGESGKYADATRLSGRGRKWR